MMTSIERRTRRQRIEGTVLILLAIFSVLQAVSFSIQDRAQNRCVEEKFGELSVALDTRSALAARETAATKRIWLVYGEYAGMVRDDPTQELAPEERERLQRDFVAALINYQQEVDKVQRERQENPVPPYPVGTCDTDE